MEIVFSSCSLVREHCDLILAAIVSSINCMLLKTSLPFAVPWHLLLGNFKGLPVAVGWLISVYARVVFFSSGNSWCRNWYW